MTGFFGVLLPGLSFLENRKQAATQGLGIVFIVLVALMLPESLELGISLWEVLLPGMLIGLAINLMFGMEAPVNADELPLVMEHKHSAIPPSPPAELDDQEDWVIEHTSNLEQVVDDQMAAMHGKGDLFLERIVSAGGTLILATLLIVFLPNDLPYQLPIVGSCAGVWILYRWITLVKRKRRGYRDAIGAEDPETYSETEIWTLAEDGLHLTDAKQSSCFFWSNLQVFEERDGGVYLEFRATIRAFIPARAFASSAEKRRWRLRIASHFPDEVYQVVAKAIRKS